VTILAWQFRSPPPGAASTRCVSSVLEAEALAPTLVVLDLRGPREPLVTDAAPEGSLLRVDHHVRGQVGLF